MMPYLRSLSVLVLLAVSSVLVLETEPAAAQDVSNPSTDVVEASLPPAPDLDSNTELVAEDAEALKDKKKKKGQKKKEDEQKKKKDDDSKDSKDSKGSEDLSKLRLQPTKDHHISVPRAALGKEFLLSASVIPQYQAPTSHALAGRIVFFELYHDGLDLYESSQGHVTTDDLPTRRLLTTFPIIRQNEQSVIIDFNQGMNRVFSESWYSSNSYDGSALTEALEVPRSRVFSVKNGQSRLEIRQSVQLRDRRINPNEEARFEVRYFISPYEPIEFETKENLPQYSRYVRFFQTHAELELDSGRSVSHIARFDISKPVVFYYSANTPKDFEHAVKDGILYWNRAFGKEIVQAKRAPEGITAPSSEHNVIQWVPWDNAGFAYADLILDPRTGRSFHGQVYLTSVFALSGQQRARLVLRRLKEKAGDEKKQPELGVGFMQSACACQFDSQEFAHQMIEGVESLLLHDVSDERILQASQDYVRNVTAHEVGHVLGLRHNFAGSLASTLNHKELEEWYEKYLTDEDPPKPEGLTSSSVMEYSHFQAAVFNGCRMRTTDEVLPHDKAAIQWGYYGKTEVKDEKLLFGTDDDVGTFTDIQRFDYGPEPVVAAFADVSDTLRNLPISVIEAFVSAKAPRDPRDRTPLEEVSLNPDSRVARLAGDYSTMFRWFSSSTRSLRLERDFPYTGQLNEEERLKQRWESLESQIEKLGGVDRIAFSFLPLDLTLELSKDPEGVIAAEKFDATKLNKQLAELLDSEAYSEFVGADGKTYSFTDEEKELIKKRAAKYFERFEEQLITRVVTALGSVRRDLGVEVNGIVSEDDFVARFEKQLAALAKSIVMAKDDSVRYKGKVDKAIVEIVDFKYDLETRMAAAKMLTDSAGTFRSWSKDARSGIGKELKAYVNSSLNIDHFKDFKESLLSRPLRQWYLEQQQLLTLLPEVK